MVNDMTILGGIVIIFVFIGFVTPFINEEFSGTAAEYNVDDVTGDLDTPNAVNAFTILISIFKIFFWTFGSIPTWLDVILFTPMRIILALIIARNVWIGGGA